MVRMGNGFVQGSYRTLLLSVAMIATGMLASCSMETTLEPEFSFTSPRPVYTRADMVAQIFGGPRASNPHAPSYADIEFFPVVSAQKLASLAAPYGKRYNDHAAVIDAIDFNTQFAFLVAHPSAVPNFRDTSADASPGIYFSTPRATYGKDEIVVKLDAKRLGGDDVGMGMPAIYWKSKVYVLERKDRNLLRVHLYDDEYVFPIVESGAGSAAVEQEAQSSGQ